MNHVYSSVRGTIPAFKVVSAIKKQIRYFVVILIFLDKTKLFSMSDQVETKHWNKTKLFHATEKVRIL